jgi:transcriptional regulator with XRE-family HTH domain
MLVIPPASQSMTQLSSNLTARRESLGLSVPQVHAELNRRGYPVAFSTVAGWFNGSKKGIRKMEHLKALCVILQADMDSLTSDEIEVSVGPLHASVARELKEFSPVQLEILRALIRDMKGRAV